MVESLANVFISIGKQKLPKLYIQRNFIGISRHIFVEVEQIVDKENKVLLVYNLVVLHAKNSYYVSITVEIDGKTTISEANFIVGRIKSKIIHNIPDVLGVLIEFLPDNMHIIWT